MARKNYFNFYPTDWIRDTRLLMPSEKGVLIDLLSFMWGSEKRGVLRVSALELSRMTGGTPDEALLAVHGLFKKGVLTGDIEAQQWFETKKTSLNLGRCHAKVTLISQPMILDQKKRESARIRKQRERLRKSPGDVTHDER